MTAHDDIDLALLNDWQHDFPLQRQPFAAIAGALALSEAEVLLRCHRLQASGALGRIGGVFGAGTGGAGLLAAMAVPPERLEAVAAQVSAHPGVNHNYEREHRHNLWFVMTGPDEAAVGAAMQSLEQATGLPALRLRMQHAYRIDLGFDMRRPAQSAVRAQPLRPAPLQAADWPLAALVEGGLPLVPRPFDDWSARLGTRADAVIATLQAWLAAGTLRRFGVVVRHHELGFDANAMTVFDVPDALVDACGAALARESAVTLAYRRERAAGWPYNLYCMVHGRDRATVQQMLGGVIARCGLSAHPHAVLFSRRRFKQIGARRFRPAPGLGAEVGTDAGAGAATPQPRTEEMRHVAA